MLLTSLPKGTPKQCRKQVDDAELEPGSISYQEGFFQEWHYLGLGPEPWNSWGSVISDW